MSTKFTIPKKAATTDLIVEKPLDSRESQHLLEVIKHSYWNPQSRIEVKKTKFVNNGTLANEYNAKRKAMKADGRVGLEVNEIFCFKYSETRKEAMEWCANGIQTNKQGLVYPCIGDQDSGIYLTRCADMVFRYPATASLTGFYLVFKVIQGKLKVVQDQFGSQTQLEPTPEFDGHVSKKFQPGKTTMTHSQIYDASQIYLYEIDLENMDYSVPGSMYVKRPRQILPYAIVQFSLNLQARDLPALRAASIESRRVSKNEPRLGAEQEAVKDAQIPQDVPKAESHDSFYHEQLRRSPVLWRGNLFNRERMLTEVQIVCHSRTGFLLPITGSVLSFRLSVKVFDLKEILPQTLFLSKPVVSQNSKVVVDDANYLHCEIHPTQPRSSAISKLIAALQRRQEALTVEFNAGNKLFILPTCQLTTDLGITDKGYPTVLHGIFMNKTRGRTVEDTDLRFCKRVRLFLERRLLELEILKADDPEQVFTAEQKFLERFKRDHAMLFSDGEKQNIKVQLTQMKKNAAKVAINRKVSMQRLALAQQRQNLVDAGQLGEPYSLQGNAPRHERANEPSIQFGAQRFPAHPAQIRPQSFGFPGHSGHKGHDVARGNTHPLVSHPKHYDSLDATNSFVPVTKPEAALEVWTREPDQTDESAMNNYYSGESRDSTGMHHSYLGHNSPGTMRPDETIGKHNANHGSARDVSRAMVASSIPPESDHRPTHVSTFNSQAQTCALVDPSLPVPDFQQNHTDMDGNMSTSSIQREDLPAQRTYPSYPNPSAIVPKPKDPRLIRVMKEDLYSQTSGPRSAQSEASDLEGGSTDMDISSDDMSQGEETYTETPSESGGEQGKSDIAIETKPENRSKRLRLDEYKKRFSAKIVRKRPSLSQANEEVPSTAAGGAGFGVEDCAKDSPRLGREGERPSWSNRASGDVVDEFSDVSELYGNEISSNLKGAGTLSRSSGGSPLSDGKKTKKDFVELFSQLAQNFVELKSVLKGEGAPSSNSASESRTVLFPTDSARELAADPSSTEQKVVSSRSQEDAPLWPPLPPESVVEENRDSYVQLPPPPPFATKDIEMEVHDSQKKSLYFDSERMLTFDHSLPPFSQQEPLPHRFPHQDYRFRDLNQQVVAEPSTRKKEFPTEQILKLSKANESFFPRFESEFEHDQPNKGTQNNDVSFLPDSAGSVQANVVLQNRKDISTSSFLKMPQPYSSDRTSLGVEAASTGALNRILQASASLPVSKVDVNEGDEPVHHENLQAEFTEGMYRDVLSLENRTESKLQSQDISQDGQFSSKGALVLDSSSQTGASIVGVVPMDIDDDTGALTVVDTDTDVKNLKGNSSLPASVEGQGGQASTDTPESNKSTQKGSGSAEPEHSLKESNSLVDLAGFSFDSGHLPWEEKEEPEIGVGLPTIPPKRTESPPKLPTVVLPKGELEGSVDPFSPNYNPRKARSLVQNKFNEQIPPHSGLGSRSEALLEKYQASQSSGSLNAPLYFRTEVPYCRQPSTTDTQSDAQYRNRSDDSSKERGREVWTAERPVMLSKPSSFDSTVRTQGLDRLLPDLRSHTVSDEWPGSWTSSSFEKSRHETFYRRTDIKLDMRSTELDTGYVSVRIRDDSHMYRLAHADERDWTAGRPDYDSRGHRGLHVHHDARPDRDLGAYTTYSREEHIRDGYFDVRARRDQHPYERESPKDGEESRDALERHSFKARYLDQETRLDRPAHREVVSEGRHVGSVRDRSFEKQRLDEFDGNGHGRYSPTNYLRKFADLPNSMVSLERRRPDEHCQKFTDSSGYRGPREDLYREFSQVQEERLTSSTPSYRDCHISREYPTSYSSNHETPPSVGEHHRHILPASEDLDRSKASVPTDSEYWRAKLQDIKEKFMKGNSNAFLNPVTERKTDSPRTLQDALELKQSEWYEDSHVDVTHSQKELSSPPRRGSEEFSLAEIMEDPDDDLHVTENEDAKFHYSEPNELAAADSRDIEGGRPIAESVSKPIWEPISPFKALDHAGRSAVTTTPMRPPIDRSPLLVHEGLYEAPQRETIHSSSYSSAGPSLHSQRLYRPSEASSQSSSLSRSQSTSGSRSYSRSRSRSRSRRYSRSRSPSHSRSYSRSRPRTRRSRRRSRSRRSYSRSLSRSRSISTSSSRSYSRSRSRSRSRRRSRPRSRSRSRTPVRSRGRSRGRSRSRSSSRSRSRSRSYTKYSSRRSKYVSERRYRGRNVSNSRSRRRSYGSDRSRSRSRSRPRSYSRSRSRRHSSQRSKYGNILSSVVVKSRSRSPILSNLQNSKKYGKWVRYESFMRQEKPERKSASKKDKKASMKKDAKGLGQQTSVLKSGKVDTKREVQHGTINFDQQETCVTLPPTVTSSAVVTSVNTSRACGGERDSDNSVAARKRANVESDIEEGQISPHEGEGGMAPLLGDVAPSTAFPSSCGDVVRLERDVIIISPVKRNVDETQLGDENTKVSNGASETKTIKKSEIDLNHHVALKVGDQSRTVESKVVGTCFSEKTGENTSTGSGIEIENSSEPLVSPTPPALSVHPSQFGEGSELGLKTFGSEVTTSREQVTNTGSCEDSGTGDDQRLTQCFGSDNKGFSLDFSSNTSEPQGTKAEYSAKSHIVSISNSCTNTTREPSSLTLIVDTEAANAKSQSHLGTIFLKEFNEEGVESGIEERGPECDPWSTPLSDRKESNGPYNDADQVERTVTFKGSCHLVEEAEGNLGKEKDSTLNAAGAQKSHTDTVNVAVSSGSPVLGLSDHQDIDSKILNIFRDSLGTMLDMSQIGDNLQRKEIPKLDSLEVVIEDDQKVADAEPGAVTGLRDWLAPSGISDGKAGTTTSCRPDAGSHTLGLLNIKEEELDDEENAVKIEKVSMLNVQAIVDQDVVLDRTPSIESEVTSVNHTRTSDVLSSQEKDAKSRENFLADKETFILSDRTLSFLDQQSCAKLTAIRDSKMEKVKRFLMSLPHDKMYVYDSTNLLNGISDTGNSCTAAAPKGSSTNQRSLGADFVSSVRLTEDRKPESIEPIYQGENSGSDPNAVADSLSEQRNCPVGTLKVESETEFHASRLQLPLGAGIEPISDHEDNDFPAGVTPNNPLIPTREAEAIQPVVPEYEQLRLWGGKLGRKEHDREAVKIFLKRLLNERKARRLDEFRRLAPEFNNNCVFGKICLDAIKSVRDKLCLKMDNISLPVSTDDFVSKEGF